MSNESNLRNLQRRLRGFAGAKSGNVSTMFALAIIPVIGLVGAAIDYSRANSLKATMQAAADATALMLSKNAATLSASDMQNKANDYFKALLGSNYTTGMTVSASYNTTTGPQVIVNAGGNVPTKFMGLLGFNSLHVGVDSQVRWGNTRLRVALVLDNTGSMASAGKMSALQTATNNLLDQLKAAATNNGDVYVSIIPFVKDVNIGSTNNKQKYMDWTEWETKNGTCSSYSGSHEPTDKTSCLAASGKWKKANHNTWNGCVEDRGLSTGPSTLNTDTNVTAPQNSVVDTQFPAEQYSDCPQAVMPLSYDWTSMKALVNAMSPAGNTNQNIGLAHGWMSLVGGGPYPDPPAEDPKYKYSKIIILLTDGLNTENRWYTSQNAIDNRQKLTCDNVKAAGVTLYTVQVNTDGDPTSTLLQNCASSTDKFFLLTSATQMVSTFQKIGTALSNLRIAQ